MFGRAKTVGMKRAPFRIDSGRFDNVPRKAEPPPIAKKSKDPGPKSVNTIRRLGDESVHRVVPVRVMESFYETIPPNENSYFQVAGAGVIYGGLNSESLFNSVRAREGEIVDISSVEVNFFLADASGIMHRAPTGILIGDVYFEMRTNGRPIGSIQYSNEGTLGFDLTASFQEVNIDIFADRWGPIPMHVIIPEGVLFEIVAVTTTVAAHPYLNSFIMSFIKGRRLPKIVWEDLQRNL